MKQTSLLTMSETLATVCPPFETTEEQATEQDLIRLSDRINSVNALLNLSLALLEKKPNLWAEIDLDDFKKYLNQNKVIIFDTQQYFQDGSHIMAVLDSMRETIRRIEHAMAKATAFNFDLDRMKMCVESETVSAPRFETPEQFVEWVNSL